ncbi:MAG: AraC family transcriptional regulator [Gemmatimonadota bacterium]|nr:AraC family transcriptional regulator [Gemmatimonadota bacterium]
MAHSSDSCSHKRVDPLFFGPRSRITDITCTCPRSPCGDEQRARDYELVFVRAGVFVKHHPTTQQRQIAAQPAHVLFLNRGESFRTSHPTSRGDVCTVIAFDAVTVRAVSMEYASRSALATVGPFPASHALVSPTAVLRLQQLRHKLRGNTAIDAVDVEAEALNLLRLVLREAWTHYGEAKRKPPRRAGERQRQVVETVKEALARQPSAATSLNDLATYTGVSAFYLARTFRREAGIPIHQYLLRLRLGTALERMSDPTVRLSAIALDAGFSSPSHFTSAFRKTFGVAPTAWRSSIAAATTESAA